MKICTAPKCTDKHEAKGFCKKHYARYRIRGHIEPTRRQSTATSLADKVAENTPKGLTDSECWEWSGNREKSGYGNLYHEGKTLKAHRVAYMVANGCELPSSVLVRHGCDNPPCVNPSHLGQGSHQDNWDDMDRRGRVAGPITAGEGHFKAVLNSTQVLSIRDKSSHGQSLGSLASEFSMSKSAIQQIVNRKTWRHI